MSASIKSELGAFFLGNLAAAILYGITCVQTFIYYQLFDKDYRVLKFAVFFLWILDTFQLAIVSRNVYAYTVSDWGNIKAFDVPHSSPWIQMIVTATSDFVVRFIYGARVWILSDQNVILTATVALSSLFAVGITLALAIKSIMVGSSAYLYTNPYVLYLSLGSSALADAIIASSLCVLLFRNRTHIKRTNSLLNTLTLYTICTGMLTGLYAIVLIVVYAALPHPTIFDTLYALSGKIYLNALLASLNVRYKLRDELYSAGTMVFNSETSG